MFRMLCLVSGVNRGKKERPEYARQCPPIYSALVSIKIKKQISMDSGRAVLSSIHGTVQNKKRQRKIV